VTTLRRCVINKAAGGRCVVTRAAARVKQDDNQKGHDADGDT
jgi:hypothetical protein